MTPSKQVSPRKQASERGAAGLEFVGVAPWVILAALITLQFGIAGWTMVSATEAARAGARAYSMNSNDPLRRSDPRDAAADALPGALSLEPQSSGRSVSGGDAYEYTVVVKMPTIFRFLDGTRLQVPPVERSATMPRIR